MSTISTYSSFALSYSTTRYSAAATDSNVEESDRRHGKGHAWGHEIGRRGNPYGETQSVQPSAMERAIDRIIDIITRMQEGDDAGSSEPDVTEANGNILEANGTDGDDDMTFTAVSVFNLTAESGDDSITIKAASVTSLQSGDGDDQVRIAAMFMTEIDSGTGNDTIEMTGLLAAGMEGGDGNDTLKIAAATILGVNGGDGDDTMSLAGDRIFAAGGLGNDILTIDNAGDRPAELSFGRGDGQDVVNSNGPINIRFTMTAFSFSMTRSGQSGYGPDELDISFTSLSIMISSKDGNDSLSINFAAGSLSSDAPQWEFDMDKGDYLMKIF